MVITQITIEAKRQEVRRAYSQFGFHSEAYQRGFDELSDMNRLFMANNFRAQRGLPPDSKTPYCPRSA